MIDFLPVDYPKLNCKHVNKAIDEISEKYNLDTFETWELFQDYSVYFRFTTNLLGEKTKDTDIHTLTDEELKRVIKDVENELKNYDREAYKKDILFIGKMYNKDFREAKRFFNCFVHSIKPYGEKMTADDFTAVCWKMLAIYG